MRTDMKYIDSLNGHQFEHFIAKVCNKSCQNIVKVTKPTDDFGIDVIEINKSSYNDSIGIQCKHVSGRTVGYSSVLEAYGGQHFYGLKRSMVITNGLFSNHAKRGADKLGVWLVDRDYLEIFIKIIRICAKNADLLEKKLTTISICNNSWLSIEAIQMIKNQNVNTILSDMINKYISKVFKNHKQQKKYKSVKRNLERKIGVKPM